jgi:hypothetical protein
MTVPHDEAREFQEIAHCGGQVIFNVSSDANGRRRYQITIQGSRPVPMAVCTENLIPVDDVMESPKLAE